MSDKLQHVLYADDEEDILSVASLALEMVGGLSVEACPGGREAIEAASSAPAPMWSCSTGMMPGMDGLELCRRLKGASHPVYFILVSSTLTNAQRERQATDAGVDQCVFKSSMPDELGRRVRDLEQHLVS